MNPVTTMQGARLLRYGTPADMPVQEVEVPALQPGQVLIRMAYASINPSDLAFLSGQYGIKKKLPAVPGFEGSGTVVASGGGWGRFLVGRRVACASSSGDGTWAQYMVADAKGCIPLRRSVSLEQGSSLIVNPMTAVAMYDIFEKGRHGALIQTVAASALGGMIRQLAAVNGRPVINIVRRDEQVNALEEQGAQYVLNSTAPDFERKLAVLARKLQATMAVDAVGGALTQQLVGCMPAFSTVLVYGGLSGEACALSPGLLIFKEAQLRGFWLSLWLQKQSPFSLMRLGWSVQKHLAGELKTEVRRIYPLTEIHAAIEDYSRQMSGGKVLINCNP